MVRAIAHMLKEHDAYTISEIEMNQLGLLQEAQIKKEIVQLDTPPNSPATIKAKTRTAGQEKASPLQDTGLMRLSATYKLVP